ncbi:SDR family oxidoreductase [Streptomyces chartreusis]|uniref:SDR family oxidoreductase n=1 Tax=Streptomyces chartreusis TaxID=1969 RepID=UPI0036CB976A
MTGKTVIVTGATAGIGLATARELARQDADVTIVGRNAEKAVSVAEQIRRESGNNQVEALVADMSSLAQVRRLADEFSTGHLKLDVLVNNVGGYWATRRTTVDGLEQTFALNHLAPFLLTNLLLENLKNAAPSRVVTVSSSGQAVGRIEIEDLQGERRYSGQRAYNQSKLANVLFTYELARRLQGTGVTANVLHPGVVRTNFGKEEFSVFIKALTPLVWPFMRTPAQGAATSVYLATSSDLLQTTGRYFVNSKPKNSSRTSRDTELATRLWRISEELTSLEDR